MLNLNYRLKTTVGNIHLNVLLYFNEYNKVIGISTTSNAPIWFADTKNPLDNVSLYGSSSYLNQSNMLYSTDLFNGEYDAYEILKRLVVIITKDIIAIEITHY